MLLFACAVAAVGDGDAVPWVGLGRIELGVHLVDDTGHLELVVAGARKLVGRDSLGEIHGAAMGPIELCRGELHGLLAFAGYRVGGGVDQPHDPEDQCEERDQTDDPGWPVPALPRQWVSLTSHLELCLQWHLEVVHAEALHRSPVGVGVADRTGRDEPQPATGADIAALHVQADDAAFAAAAPTPLCEPHRLLSGDVWFCCLQ